jgi:hypothetical protein
MANDTALKSSRGFYTMAKRTKPASPAEVLMALALLGAAALVTVVSYLAPAAILLLLIYYEVRAARLPQMTAAAQFVDHEDLADLQPLHSRRFQMQARLHDIETTSARAGLSLRTDGQFDARNPLGRDFNRELDQLTVDLQETEQAIDQAKRDVVSRLRGWLRALSGRLTFRTIVVVYLVAVSVGYVIKSDINPALVIAAIVCMVLTPLVWLVDYQRRKYLLPDIDEFLQAWQTTDPAEQPQTAAKLMADADTIEPQLQFKPHDTVEARWTDGLWYPAEIVRGDGSRYEVRWDDWDPKDTAWMPVHNIRAYKRI